MKVSLRFHNGISIEDREFECDRLDIDVNEVYLWKDSGSDESCADLVVFAIDRTRFIFAEVDDLAD